MNGIINVYKEAGWTSSDVVNKLKGMLHERHIGHGGTLDPDAEGVLPVCVGKATRLFDYITVFRKTYLAKIKFGASTDTQDASGTILETHECNITSEQIDGVLNRFTGDIFQMPPMYSALHINGKRLYELARSGETVEIEPRMITVYDISRVGEVKSNECLLRVTCGKGTYIRTLCHDIGQALGCGAYMAHLTREQAAGLDIGNSLKITDIETMIAQNDFSFIMPTDTAISYMPAVIFDESAYKKLCNGNPIKSGSVISGADTTVFARIYCNNKFFGIGEKKNGVFYIKCMLAENV